MVALTSGLSTKQTYAQGIIEGIGCNYDYLLKI